MKKRLGMVALVLVVLMAMFSVVIGCSNEIETPRFGSLTLSTDGSCHAPSNQAVS
jgi:hypothetical protein